MTVRKLGGATIEKVEEICGAGFKPARMFPNFNQEAFDAQKAWMLPDHVEPGSDRLVGSVHTWVVASIPTSARASRRMGHSGRRSGNRADAATASRPLTQTSRCRRSWWPWC